MKIHISVFFASALSPSLKTQRQRLKNMVMVTVLKRPVAMLIKQEPLLSHNAATRRTE
jgi:hypothetical protein